MNKIGENKSSKYRKEYSDEIKKIETFDLVKIDEDETKESKHFKSSFTMRP